MAIVWASSAMINPANLRPLTHNFDNGTEEGKRIYSEARRRNDAGESLTAQYFPSEIYVDTDARTNYDRLPDLFFAGSYWAVSKAAADVLRRFDLGGGGLFPVKVLKKDRQTPIEGEYFCINFGNVKRALLPEQSAGMRPLGPSKTFWKPNDLNDNSIALNIAALDGPDVWVDSIGGDVFFVSDPLAKALKTAGVARAFGLTKCRVI